jgi:hypothetical protein
VVPFLDNRLGDKEIWPKSLHLEALEDNLLAAHSILVHFAAVLIQAEVEAAVVQASTMNWKLADGQESCVVPSVEVDHLLVDSHPDLGCPVLSEASNVVDLAAVLETEVYLNWVLGLLPLMTLKKMADLLAVEDPNSAVALVVADIPSMLLDAVDSEDNNLPEAFSFVVDEDNFLEVDSFQAKCPDPEAAFDLHSKTSAVVEPLLDSVVDSTHSDH